MFRVADLSQLLQLSYEQNQRALTTRVVIPGRHKVWIECKDVISFITDLFGEIPIIREDDIPEQVPLANLSTYIPVCGKPIRKWIKEGMLVVQVREEEIEVNPFHVYNG